MSRPSWDQYFMAFAYLAASRSTCIRRKVGAIIVKKHHILASGYNGLHAEQNAIVQAAAHGTKIAASTIYCTNQPCGICAKMIVNAGIKRIVYAESYIDSVAVEAFAEAGIEPQHVTCPNIDLPYSLLGLTFEVKT
jgi:dCMP deaminase